MTAASVPSQVVFEQLPARRRRDGCIAGPCGASGAVAADGPNFLEYPTRRVLGGRVCRSLFASATARQRQSCCVCTRRRSKARGGASPRHAAVLVAALFLAEARDTRPLSAKWAS